MSCLATNTLSPYIPRNTFLDLKIFRENKNRILPPWVMSSLSSCRNLLAYHSYSKIFPGNETGDIHHGCLHIWDGCPIFAVVIFSFSSYFGTIIFYFRIIGWAQCPPYSFCHNHCSHDSVDVFFIKITEMALFRLYIQKQCRIISSRHILHPNLNYKKNHLLWRIITSCLLLFGEMITYRP